MTSPPQTSPNPTRAASDWPPVVVASVFQTGLNLMRDLLRRGLTVVGIDSHPEHPGFRSRYGKSFLCPSPYTNPGEWLSFMIEFSRQFNDRPVLIPCADEFVTAVAQYGSELQKYYRFPVDTAPILEALGSKQTQYALAAEQGLPCPKTMWIRSAQDLEVFIREASFPVLMKPRRHLEWIFELPDDHRLHWSKFARCENGTQLLDAYASVSSYVPEAVVQEIIEGPDTAKYCYLSVYGKQGRRLGYCVVQELRCDIPEFGSASVVAPVNDPDVERVCDSFLSGIGFTGICEIEVKRDRAGKVKLIEVNPRFSVTGDAARCAGVEVGWIHYLDMIGHPCTPVDPRPDHFHHITLVREVSCLPVYFKKRLLTLGGLFRTYRPPLYFFDVDLRDPRVAFKTLWLSGRGFAGTIYRTYIRPRKLPS